MLITSFKGHICELHADVQHDIEVAVLSDWTLIVKVGGRQIETTEVSVENHRTLARAVIRSLEHEGIPMDDDCRDSITSGVKLIVMSHVCKADPEWYEPKMGWLAWMGEELDLAHPLPSE